MMNLSQSLLSVGNAQESGKRRHIIDRRDVSTEWQACFRELMRRNRNSANKACCGSQIYDYRYYMCCDGHRKRSGSTLVCCGKYAYDLKREMCCGGSVHLKPSGRPACCGTRAYDKGVGFCCGSTVAYRWSHICCDDKPRRKPSSSSACCGTEVYDSEEYMCRGGRIEARQRGPGYNE